MKKSEAISKTENSVFIASDHAGFALKSQLIKHLQQKNFRLIDLGCDDSNHSVDYPLYAQNLAKKLTNEFGILICGSGIGISIAANRFKNIRAALCMIPKHAKLARAHNNANVICLGARFTGFEVACEMVDIFLEEKFEGGRHQARIDAINDFSC
jgi:ribose 5-phosphate isomerase B